MLITATKDDALTLCCDASKFAYGYVLYSNRGTLSYGGGSFSKNVVQSHNIFEKETLAMSYSLSDCYKLIVNGKSLTIKCDNLSLVTINKNNKVIVTPRIVRYLTNISILAQTLPTNFVHLGTLDNTLADYISRASYSKDGSMIEPNTRTYTAPDQSFMSLNDKPKLATDCEKDLFIYYKKLHNNFHWSVKKTTEALKMYGIPVNEDLITEAWLECPFCQQFKRASPLSKLKFRQAPERPFDEIHIDHIIKSGEQTSSFGEVAAFTVKCALTRYFFVFPCKDLQIRTVVTQLRNLFMSVGRQPKAIYGDNAFDSKTLRDLCESENIALAFRATHLSRSVSVESTHRRLHEKIKSLLGKRGPSHWHEVAFKAAMAINCQPNDTIGFSPYYLFYGHHPMTLGSLDVPTNVEIDQHWLNDLKIAKGMADSKRKAKSADYNYPKFSPGHVVYIRPDNSKNASSLMGTVLEDNGGATLIIKLENRARPLPVHKGMVFAKKYSDAWKLLNNSTRDFHEFMNADKIGVDLENIPISRVADRTRNKTKRRKLRAEISSPYTRLSKKKSRII